MTLFNLGYIYWFKDNPPLINGPGEHWYIVIDSNDTEAEMLQFTSTDNEEGTFFSRGGEYDFCGAIKQFYRKTRIKLAHNRVVQIYVRTANSQKEKKSVNVSLYNTPLFNLSSEAFFQEIDHLSKSWPSEHIDIT